MDMDMDMDMVRYMVPSVHGRQRGRSSRRGRSEEGYTAPSRGLLGRPAARWVPGHRGAVSNQQRHWDEQVPASMERIHGLHDDVRTRGVAREAVEHAFERADESRVAYDPHS